MDATDDETRPAVTPDEAFSLLGHETRVRILEVLATTPRPERPVAFSVLRERVGDIDSAHFNYHLGELTGHFLERTDDGYDFRRPGRRVAQAILSGAVTGNPLSDLQPVDQRCPHCGGAVEVMFHRGRVALYCTECSGTYGSSNYQVANDDVPDEYGFLGLHDLPPSGLAERTPTEAVAAAHRWSLSDTLSMASDLCPRCGGTFDDHVDVCEAHDGGDGVCERCGYRHAVIYTASCTNCTFDSRLPFGVTLLAETELQAFVTDHGINLASADYGTFTDVFKSYAETVVSADPLEATFTFAIDGDECALTVDDDLDVVDVSR